MHKQDLLKEKSTDGRSTWFIRTPIPSLDAEKITDHCHVYWQISSPWRCL